VSVMSIFMCIYDSVVHFGNYYLKSGKFVRKVRLVVVHFHTPNYFRFNTFVKNSVSNLPDWRTW
jgi:hypothetical protein